MSESSGNIISYRKRRIWGIKSLIQNFVGYIYRRIVSEIPENHEINSNMMDPILFEIGREFQVYEPYLRSGLDELKHSREVWLALDSEQKTAFKISAFFDALDQTREDLATHSIMAVSKLFYQEPLIPNYKLHDFGFLFRAREYASVYSRLICNNGYANTVRRISRVLKDEFEDIFINQRDVEEESKPIDSTILERVTELTEVLQNGTDAEILGAIDEIQEKHLFDAQESLHFLLNHPNEEIQARALDVIMDFEGEEMN